MAKRYTHHLEVVAPQGMQVRLLSRAILPFMRKVLAIGFTLLFVIVLLLSPLFNIPILSLVALGIPGVYQLYQPYFEQQVVTKLREQIKKDMGRDGPAIFNTIVTVEGRISLNAVDSLDLITYYKLGTTERVYFSTADCAVCLPIGQGEMIYLVDKQKKFLKPLVQDKRVRITGLLLKRHPDKDASPAIVIQQLEILNP